MQTGRPRSIREAAFAAGGDPWDAVDEFMDEFYLAHPDRAAQQSMIDEAPELTGDTFLDAYLAAMGEHLAMRWNLRTPRWTHEEERMDAGGPRFVPDNAAIKPILLVESPYAFRTRNIFTGREPLQRARWPRDAEKVDRLMAP